MDILAINYLDAVAIVALLATSFFFVGRRHLASRLQNQIAETKKLINDNSILIAAASDSAAELAEQLAKGSSAENAMRLMSEAMSQIQGECESLKKGSDILCANAVSASVAQSNLQSDYDGLSQRFQLIEVEKQQLSSQLEALRDVAETSSNIDALRQDLSLYEQQHEVVSAGLYQLTIDFGVPDVLRTQLEEKRAALAAMIREKTAAVCSTKWSINGSSAEGAKATKHYVRIMLRAFNADADVCIELVRWNNFDRCVARLRSSFDAVNELGSSHATRIVDEYFDLRVEQIKLMHKYREALHQSKEAIRAARQALREEHRANREIEQARTAAEQEECRYSQALERARRDLDPLVGDERESMNRRIVDLENSLAIAVSQKLRAISMAQITKAGFVYVVSNIGSFGSDVLKIGMTRRIDPNERIRELGGASVPFGFDVHAMIYSNNAPELENLFHRKFARDRINLANGRKEFFRVPLEKVVEYATTLSLNADFATQVEARDFVISSRLREDVIDSLTDAELAARIGELRVGALTSGEGEDGEDGEDGGCGDSRGLFAH